VFWGIEAGPTVGPLLPILAVPLLVALFYFDGMVIGKFLPPAAFFVSYVALLRPPSATLLPVSLACVVAATLGQWTLYRGLNDESPEFFGIRRRVPYVDRVPLVVRGGIGDRRMRIVDSLFDRFGGFALPVVNVIPGVRSLLTIPCGIESISGRAISRVLVPRKRRLRRAVGRCRDGGRGSLSVRPASPSAVVRPAAPCGNAALAVLPRCRVPERSRALSQK